MFCERGYFVPISDRSVEEDVSNLLECESKQNSTTRPSDLCQQTAIHWNQSTFSGTASFVQHLRLLPTSKQLGSIAEHKLFYLLEAMSMLSRFRTLRGPRRFTAYAHDVFFPQTLFLHQLRCHIMTTWQQGRSENVVSSSFYTDPYPPCSLRTTSKHMGKNAQSPRPLLLFASCVPIQR